MKVSQPIIALLLGSLLTGPLQASDERLKQLEVEVRDLKGRIKKLEDGHSQADSSSQKAKTSEGWRDLSNWRSLKRGMSYDDVRMLLGEPSRIQGGSFTFWQYKNASSARFFDDRLDSWTEPTTR